MKLTKRIIIPILLAVVLIMIPSCAINPVTGKRQLMLMSEQQSDPEQAANTVLNDLNLSVLDSKRAEVNGMPAVATVYQQVSQNAQTGGQQVIKVLSYFIKYVDEVFVFHGVASDADFNSFFRMFESTMINFNRLTEPSKLDVRPRRIIVKEVQHPGTVAEIFRSYNIPNDQMRELTLLNNLELSDNIGDGELIKTIS